MKNAGLTTRVGGFEGGVTNSNFFFGGGGALFLGAVTPPLCHVMPCLSYVDEDIYIIIVETGNWYGIPNSHLKNILHLHPEGR